MFDVRDVAGPPLTIELSDAGAASVAVLAPARGGMLIGFAVAGRQLLYLDPVSFADLGANVRGGVPVLFPSPGKLTNDVWSSGGKGGAMRQHGFARNVPWTVTDRSTEHHASVTLEIAATEATLPMFPWRFRASYVYSLRGSTLRIDQTIRNEDVSAMPFGAGFHPYFGVPQQDKKRARIPTRATRAFDNVSKREIPFEGFDLTQPEVDLHLIDHGSSEATLVLGDGASVVLRGSREFTRWVVWTLENRDFVCLEPWTCPADALNTGEDLIVVPAGGSREIRLELEFRP